MKKIFLKVILGAGLFACVFSCSDDFLREKRDYQKMVPIDIYSDPVQANAVFAVFYKQILENLSSPVAAADPLMRQTANTGGQQYILSDEAASGAFGLNVVGDGRYNGDNSKNSKAGNHIANPTYWNDPSNGGTNKNFNNFSRKTLFPTIYHINNFIIEIDRTGRAAYDNEEFWDHLKGQAIFARAWLQFDGLRFYGGAPYYPTETDQPDPTDKSLRMAVPDVIEKICIDFETAANLLPAKWDDENNHGRFTSVAAWAMLSRVRLYAASPVFNASWDNPSGQRWQLALEASLKAETEAKAAGYGSSVNSIDSWDKTFYAYNGIHNPEAIITVPKSNLTTAGSFNKWEGFVRPGVVALSTGGGIPATDQLMMKFPMKNGMPPTAENGYDDEKFYRDRDPRFYKTFAFLRFSWPGIVNAAPAELFAYKYSDKEYRYTDGSQGDGGARGKSRAIVWKMSDPAVPRASESTASTDVIEYRFAEILLNVAECYAAQGNVAQAKSYLEQIRNRVGAGTADLAAITDRYSAIAAVLNERAVELAFEGKRSTDMRRWLLFEGGAGFDPRLASSFNNTENSYDPQEAWGLGWKLYDGTNGKGTYTASNNVLTKLGLPLFAGSRHTSKIWAYDLETIYAVNPTGGNADERQYPLHDNADLKAVVPITRDMNETQRNAAFDSWEAFLETPEGQKMKLIEPGTEMGTDTRYRMDSGTSVKQLNFQFSWRGWYYVYPIHYDMYTAGKGNTWLTQTEGWMVANANPAGNTSAEQDGTYVYCTPE